jgi:hypothetical protein
MTQKNNLIFVSIASYRDPELLPTLRDIFLKAKHPELLRIGICWQKTAEESIEEFAYNENVKIHECSWENSKGACWARHIIQKHLYTNEEYYLQLDSHHRFLENWDEHLKKLYTEASSDKPIIGGYGTTYWPNKPDKPLKNEPYRIITFDSFAEDGDIVSRPQLIMNHKFLKSQNINLIPARLLSGHFIFTSGRFCRECIYDPNLYFRGEEVTLSARAYTHGYDMFHPTYSIIWHEYLRKEQHKHWEDHVSAKSNFDGIEAEARNVRSKQRQRALFNMEVSNIDFRHYGFGKKRTLHEYELYAGLDFSNRKVHKNASRINDSTDIPEPYVMTEEEWAAGMMRSQSYTVEWDYNDIPDNTIFDFWFFGFEDKDDKLLWRQDFNQDNNFYHQFFRKQNNKFTASFSCDGTVDHCVIIPHIKDGDWAKKILIKV